MTVATLQKLENAGFDRKQAVALVDEMERAHFVLQVGVFRFWSRHGRGSFLR